MSKKEDTISKPAASRSFDRRRRLFITRQRFKDLRRFLVGLMGRDDGQVTFSEMPCLPSTYFLRSASIETNTSTSLPTTPIS